MGPVPEATDDAFESEGPWATKQIGDWFLRVLVGEDADEGAVDFEVESPDGVRYSGTASTLEQLGDLMRGWQSSGECLSGSYLWMSDLLVVRPLDLATLAAAVTDLIETGEVVHALSRLDGPNR